MQANRVIDNQRVRVADVLNREFRRADAFDLVSVHFSIYGYELLMDELDGLDKARFLFGDPTSVEDLDTGDKAPKSFTVTEGGLTPTTIGAP